MALPVESYKQKAEQFLSVASQFSLGELSTEKPHPLTHNLSELAVGDLPEAIRLLKRIDEEALAVLHDKVANIQALAKRIRQTLDAGRRVFLCGCGATGRLALTLETLWREKYRGKVRESSICSFMAGGDVALIKSVENFEDFVLFGVKQLLELGFVNGDLLISSTEGGETPFVIGATETAARLSSNRPCFLYCNPDAVLIKAARRSKRIIENSAVVKINCDVGPMALAGSTRMQASTVLMTVVGTALACHKKPGDIPAMISELIDLYKNLDLSFLEGFIEKESGCYLRGEYLFYDTEPHFGITILTDTTERAPTFSLHPFENCLDDNAPVSLCYILFPNAKSSETAWRQLLHREPRTLAWDETSHIASHERLLGFDFSKKLVTLRKKRTKNTRHHHFRIYRSQRGISLELEEQKHLIRIKRYSLFEHLALKMLLNIHSTLVMGRLARYERNIMTWVRPSNNKLIDRTIRYVGFLLREKGINLSYDTIAYKSFELMEKTQRDQSLVLAVVNSLMKLDN